MSVELVFVYIDTSTFTHARAAELALPLLHVAFVVAVCLALSQ